MAQMQREARRTARKAQGGAPGTDSWLETAGRIGYAAKGVVYTIVGVLAVQAAFTGGGQTTGAKGAIQKIASQSFGKWLLILTGIGLAGYALWRLAIAIFDPEGKGTDGKGIVKRLGYAGSGIVNGALAYYALRIAATAGSGGGGGAAGGGSKQAMTAKLMSQSYGQILVGLVGAIIIGVGLYHFYKAVKATFMEKYKAGEMSATERTWAKRIGRLGLSARGVAFAMIGIFFIQAAVQAQPQEAGGLGKAFDELLSQPYGPWLLGLVAIGFVCYGIYCFSYARYRHFQTAGAPGG